MGKSLQDRRTELLERMAILAVRMEEIGTELESHNNPDWSDLATEREADEVLEGIGLSAQAEIRAIEAALQRVGGGKYGTCTRCGADIGEDRLDLLPFTPFCRDCAAHV
ncbi:MAG: TraR/DksA C4-type zinc finger protein [Pseudotabrizicola sp.]|uniref:TraR/DksA family transcriptional regulator n=1 Tax=Pseudotabrizicola sp. TaxID=2939647 RepID=UPI0027292327|nr:TraR/DksA C4-type zinc finger protein [Pseudotabrizicola sp.]MDO9637318.1 TraR/DksA C4-type zinc finger protein [Pseudotabrizicola sp.]